MPSFGELLKAARESAGIGQSELSRRSDVSQDAISKYELGKREPTWEIVQKLAIALEVDCRHFVTVEKPPKAKKATKPNK